MDANKPEPGSFRAAPDETTAPTASPQAPLLAVSKTLAEALIAVRDQVYSPDSVLYPSCGFDATPAQVFPQVTFVDREDGNTGCISQLQAKGLIAIRQDIRTYKPSQPHDLLILLNPQIPPDWATTHLQSGGYVVTNNYHGTAWDLHKQQSEFEPIGTVHRLPQGLIVSRKLEDLVHLDYDYEPFTMHKNHDHIYIFKKK